MVGAYRSIGHQPACKMLGVVVYLVFRCSITESCDLSIISICEDSASLVFERWREKVCGPEHFGRFVCSPGIAAQVLAKLACGKLWQQEPGDLSSLHQEYATALALARTSRYVPSSLLTLK
jgi:hypothetical protein